MCRVSSPSKDDAEGKLAAAESARAAAERSGDKKAACRRRGAPAACDYHNTIIY